MCQDTKHSREARSGKFKLPDGKAERLPTAAKIHVDDARGGATLYAAIPAGSDIAAQFRRFEGGSMGEPVLDFISTTGERVSLAWQAVVSVVIPRDEIPIYGAVLAGKRIEVRTLSDEDFELAAATGGMPAELRPHTEQALVVYGEDLAGAEIVVFRPDTGERLWTNPAADPHAVDLFVLGATVIAQAEYVEDTAMEAEEAERQRAAVEQARERNIQRHLASVDVPTESGLTPEQDVAVKSIESGDALSKAVELTGEVFVATYLSERAFGDKCTKVLLDTGLVGEITAYRPDGQLFRIDTHGQVEDVEVRLNQIVRLCSEDADTFQPGD